LFGKKRVTLAWISWDEAKGEFQQPVMVLDRIAPGEVALSVAAPLITGFGITADPPNPLTPFWTTAFGQICGLGPPHALEIDFARGQGMREEQLIRRLQHLREVGAARQDAGSIWTAEWSACNGPLELLNWVHGCGYDYMWRFGDIALTDSDGRTLLVLGPQSKLDGIAGMFARLAAQLGFKVDVLSTI
jgi:hypothetical protein